MKNNFIYLLLLLVTLTTACVKKPKIVDHGPPLGIFTGQFLRIHHKLTNYDTLKADIRLILSANIGFSVQGDTSTLHAGSYGTFNYDPSTSLMIFKDDTYTGVTTPGKIHLNGTYLYAWDGAKLEIGGAVGDTLIYDYKLNKIGN